MQRVHFLDFWGFLGTSIVSCDWNTWKLPWKFWECPALNHRSSVSKLRTHKHHRKSKLKFGKSFNCNTYDNHPGLGSQGNHYKPVFLPWLLKIQPSHFQWSQTRPPNQRFPPEVANPKELKAAEPRSPSTATVLRPRSFRAWASMFLQLSKTDMDGHGWHHETDDQIIIWGKPMENPEFFFEVISTWRENGPPSTTNWQNTSTTPHKPMVVLGSIELSRIGKFEERLI